MCEMITLNDWRKVNIMMDDRKLYDQQFIDGVYRKLQLLIEAADEHVKQEHGKKYEVGFDIVNGFDHLLGVTLTVPVLYVASPSDCIEQSLGSDQPTACPLGKPWNFDDLDDLFFAVNANIRAVDHKVRMQLATDE